MLWQKSSSSWVRAPSIPKRLSSNKQTKLIQPLSWKDTIITVEDATNFDTPNSLKNLPGVVEINGERIEYFAKSGNILTVIRGSDQTVVSNHVFGADIKKITSEDDQLIEVGDDFGFSGSFSWKWQKNLMT